MGLQQYNPLLQNCFHKELKCDSMFLLYYQFLGSKCLNFIHSAELNSILLCLIITEPQLGEFKSIT